MTVDNMFIQHTQEQLGLNQALKKQGKEKATACQGIWENKFSQSSSRT